MGLLNGTLWDVTEILDKDDHSVTMTITPEEGGNARVVTAPAEPFLVAKPGDTFTPGMMPFTYGYTLTVHKAQGSQWDNVLLFNEMGMCRTAEAAQQWLYTGITRAAKRITILHG
jgi:exodeoxyribonuclease-5